MDRKAWWATLDTNEVTYHSMHSCNSDLRTTLITDPSKITVVLLITGCQWAYCTSLLHPFLTGSSAHGILQARIFECVTIPFSRGSSQPRDRIQVSHMQAASLSPEPQEKPFLNLHSEVNFFLYPKYRKVLWGQTFHKEFPHTIIGTVVTEFLRLLCHKT